MGFIEYMMHSIFMTISALTWSLVMIFLLTWGISVLCAGTYSEKEKEKRGNI